MKVEKFRLDSRKHMDIVHAWWNARMPVGLPESLLSDYGFMAFEQKKPLCAVFFYPVLGSKVALVGFPVAAPSLKEDERVQAIDIVVANVERTAKLLNYQWLVSYPGNKKAQGMFERLKYRTGDTEVVQYMREL